MKAFIVTAICEGDNQLPMMVVQAENLAGAVSHFKSIFGEELDEWGGELYSTQLNHVESIEKREDTEWMTQQ